MQDVIIFNEDRTSDLNPYNDRWIIFNEDLSFTSGGSLGRNTGAFSVNDGILTLDSDAGSGDDSEWQIQIMNDSLIMQGVGSERQESSYIYNTRANPEYAGISITSREVPASVRALEISESGDIWFAGSGGTWGYSVDDGESWTIKTLEFEGEFPHFRSLAINGKAVFLLSIESPALLFRTTDYGENWELVYREDGDGIFYDALEFADDTFGMAVGDTHNGCLSVVTTIDGGKSWEKVSCEILPPSEQGEGFFAASDTNLKMIGTEIWMGTTKSRILYSPDSGKSWKVFKTPLNADSTSEGIFSLDFRDAMNGIIVGGDYQAPEGNYGNKAITSDGGRTWELVADGREIDYRSCVRYLPGNSNTPIWAVGFRGISVSNDSGMTWQKLSNAPYYTLRWKDKKNGWLAGNKVIGKMVID